MECIIPVTSGEQLTVSVEVGQQLYVVGANGTGKSALFQFWLTSISGSPVKRVAAHRQTWFESGALEITARSRRQLETNMKSWDSQENARWMEHSPAERQMAVLFDLVSKDNARSRTIGQYVDNNDLSEATNFASKSESLFRQLNDLLRLGTLTVSLSNSNDEEILAQNGIHGQSFSIARMSDGERAAVLMAANVLTVEPGTILLIDEPERHLHRSIIEPFLSALFAKRKDCAFAISTHEIALPIANPTASVILLRSCTWNGTQPTTWDADTLESGSELPEDLKRDILGARKRILFVEGKPSSRDLPLYGALFPMLSVIPKGSYHEVIRATSGLRSSRHHHHVEAFGLIDRDDREPDEIARLAEGGVFALEVCSVESLYYCSDSIEAIAHRQSESLERDPHEMISAAVQNALSAISTESGLPERMAARRSERRVASQIEKLIPDWRVIMGSGENLEIPATVESPYTSELAQFNDLLKAGDLNRLIARYPLRDSSILDRISEAMRCKEKSDYERMLVVRVQEDDDLARKLKDRIKPLAELLESTSHE